MEEEFRATFKRAVDKNFFDLVGKTFQICSTRKDHNAWFPRISNQKALVFVCIQIQNIKSIMNIPSVFSVGLWGVLGIVTVPDFLSHLSLVNFLPESVFLDRMILLGREVMSPDCFLIRTRSCFTSTLFSSLS